MINLSPSIFIYPIVRLLTENIEYTVKIYVNEHQSGGSLAFWCKLMFTFLLKQLNANPPPPPPHSNASLNISTGYCNKVAKIIDIFEMLHQGQW